MKNMKHPETLIFSLATLVLFLIVGVCVVLTDYDIRVRELERNTEDVQKRTKAWKERIQLLKEAVTEDENE